MLPSPHAVFQLPLKRNETNETVFQLPQRRSFNFWTLSTQFSLLLSAQFRGVKNRIHVLVLSRKMQDMTMYVRNIFEQVSEKKGRGRFAETLPLKNEIRKKIE